MLNFLFNPNGRISRVDIWLKFFLPFVAVNIAAALGDAVLLGGGGAPVLSILVMLFYFWPQMAVAVKRLHDLNLSGWWLLAFFAVAVVGVLMSAGSIIAASAGAAKQGATAGAGLGVAIVVIGGLVQFVMLYVLPGKSGENRFGPDPRDPSARTASAKSSDGASASAWAAGAIAALETAPSAGVRGATVLSSRNPISSSEPWRPGQPRPSFGRRGA